MNDLVTTERLQLRRVKEDDWKAIKTIWEEVKKTPWAQYDNPKEVDDGAVLTRIGKWAEFAENMEHLFLAVCLEEKVIGYVTFNQRDYGYEIGYCFHPYYHGQGFANESISELLRRIKTDHMIRIEAGTALDNTPSIALLSRLGFQQITTEQVPFYKDSIGNDIFFTGGVFELLLQ